MAVEAKDVSSQIGILKSRGMIINNVAFTRNVLERKNYYNVINAFKNLFLITSNPETYITNTTFEEIYSMYLFDARLRELFLKYILIAENELKTNISREISLHYNSSPYFSDSIYDMVKRKKVSEFQENLLALYKMNRTNPMISHFIDRGDMVPLWAFVNVFDLGTMRKFYDILSDPDKGRIANIYSISINQLYSIMSGMNFYRNVCAHNNRLYNFRLIDDKMQISDLPIHSNMHIDTITTPTGAQFLHGKKDLFSMVIGLRYLLNDDDFKSFYHQLSNYINHLNSKLNVVTIDKILNEMGFPLSNTNGQMDWKCIVTVAKL